MKPLEIVTFTDGRPGHEKQTQGVLQALANLTATTIVESFKVRPAFKTGLINWLQYLLPVFQHPVEPGGPVDLIFGTGSYTHIPMLLFRKTRQGRVVTCMTPDFPLQRRFDLCFIPHHDRQKPAANFFFTVGAPNNLTAQHSHEKDKGLILIGGIDTGSHTWSSEQVVDRIRFIIGSDPSISWTISSSPRTPADMVLPLDDLAGETDRVVFFRSEETGPGWIESAYASHERVWVTADSVSMICEALTAGCRVGVLPVQWKRPDNKFQRNLDDLKHNGQIVLFDDWKSGVETMKKGAGLNEASRCAEEILRRWWPDRLK